MSVFDLSGAVLALGQPLPLNVIRYASSDYLEGRLQDAEPLIDEAGTFQIFASVQPSSGRDMAVLPEGQQSSEALTLFTTTELYTVGSTHGADIVEFEGSTWEVQHVERWASLGNYWRAIAVRVESEGT